MYSDIKIENIIRQYRRPFASYSIDYQIVTKKRLKSVKPRRHLLISIIVNQKDALIHVSFLNAQLMPRIELKNRKNKIGVQ